VTPPDLERFVDAQDRGDTYNNALAELRAGAKRSHWMWFVFPQVAGLGRSPMARQYAIADLGEARAYAEHPVLGPRLVAAAQAVLAHAGTLTVFDVLGGIDALKLRSSMTLFARAAPHQPVFHGVLAAFYNGVEDPDTVSRLR
jgi:uncharacterized protein (DUF1810 family)